MTARPTGGSAQPGVTDERHWRLGLLAVVVLATAARAAMLLGTLHFTLFGDPEDYQRHAVSIAIGHGFAPTAIASAGTPSAFRPPGYPLTLGGLYAVVGVHPQAGRALSALLGVVTVVLIAYLGRAVWGRRTGLVAGGIAAVFPPLVALNASLLSEALFLPLELAFALTLVMLARHPDRTRWALAAGAACALAALTRAVADAWMLIALAVILTAAVPGARKWRSAAAAIAAFVIVLVPWTIRNAAVLHALVPISTESGYTLAGQYNPVAGADNQYQAVWRDPLEVSSIRAKVVPLYRRPGGVNEAQLDHALRNAGLDYLGAHPGHLPVATGFDTLRLFDLGKSHAFVTALAYREMAIPGSLQDLTTRTAQAITLLALFVVAAAIVPRTRTRTRTRIRLGPWWLWAIPVLTLLLTVPVVGNPLKRAALDPFLILLTSAGLAAVASRVSRRRPPRPAPANAQAGSQPVAMRHT
jgi:4-amino-4-deoxy-L-arabinose transferase-like glycosyltransferase